MLKLIRFSRLRDESNSTAESIEFYVLMYNRNVWEKWGAMELVHYLIHSCDKVLFNPYTQNQVLSN